MAPNQDQYDDLDQERSRLFTVRLGTAATIAPMWEDLDLPVVGAAAYDRGRIVEDKYRIEAMIGRGGMGVVYKAHQLALNKDVALKTFSRADIREEDWARFKREAQAIARLNDAGVVQVLDFGVDSGRPYYTMELLQGQGLDDYLREHGVMDIRTALGVFIQVAQGLAAAHRKGVVHRDIKPANIFLAEDGRGLRAKIVDFGIATLISDKTERATQEVEIFGSPLYMSPEQFQGDLSHGAASDIYSFGCTLFEALAGRPPFHGANALATMYMHLEQPPPRLSSIVANQGLPQRLDGLVDRLLAKDIAARPGSMDQVIRELKELSARSSNDTRLGAVTVEKDEITRTGIRRNGVLSVTCLLACIAAGAYLIIKFYNESQAPPVKASAPPGRYRVSDNFDSMANIPLDDDHNMSLIQKGASEVVSDEAMGNPHKWPHVEEGSFDKSRRADRFLGNRLFEFPAGFKVGDFAHGDQSIPGQGQVLVPEKAVLNISADFKISPQLLDGFKSDSILRLRLPRYIRPTNDHFRHLARLTAIKELRFGDAVVDDETVSSLNKLNELHNLELTRVHLQSERVGRLTCLPRLTDLRLNKVEHAGWILEKLEGNVKLVNLDLSECNLADSDMEAVSKIPNLQYLGLEDNRYLTENGIRPLLKLYGLKHLDLRKCHIAPAVLEVLNGFHSLTKCDINTEYWTPAQKAELMSILRRNEK